MNVIKNIVSSIIIGEDRISIKKNGQGDQYNIKEIDDNTIIM